jgi:ABC-2 type transport system ATP-binding protein
MASILQVKALHKRFGRFEVLKDINLDIKENQIFGIIGPNGAGKTTLLRCILGILRFQEGHIKYKGEQLREDLIREKFGYLPENFYPNRNLKVIEFLTLLADKERAFELLKLVGLEKRASSRIRTLSRGMIQRLGVAFALIDDPEVIVLDEPTLGLDPLGQTEMVELLRILKEEHKKTIIISSHILNHLEKLVDEVAVLNQGKVFYKGELNDFLNRHGAVRLEEAFVKELKDGQASYSNV